MILNKNTIAHIPCPGTSLKLPGTNQTGGPSPAVRLISTCPITSSSGRFFRLGMASMLTSPDGPFINLSRLNLTKYAQKPKLAKALFEYILHHENDVKTAVDLAALSTEHSQYKDW
ncbi:hypothetical protein EI555_019387 [Monodon monoceros]|uniref:Uncharacterized protein n=1 Tax=Monodon monoceros TaxID=40151 RepID=A0A4U1EQ19_MONMO|nr:hypothetical protein EI555_019387 [Monodon monoceros]